MRDGIYVLIGALLTLVAGCYAWERWVRGR